MTHENDRVWSSADVVSLTSDPSWFGSTQYGSGPSVLVSACR